MRLVIVAVGLVACICVGLFWYYEKPTEQEIVDKVFEDYDLPVREAGDLPVSEEPSVEELVSEELPVEAVVSYTDSDVSRLWFDIRQPDVKNVQDTMDALVEAIKQVLGSGDVPSVAVSFPAVIIDGEDAGFSHISFDYDNGVAGLLSMILPEVVEERVVSFLYVQTDDGSYVKVEKDNVYPMEYVLNGNSLMVAGPVLNDRAFTDYEDLSIRAFVLEYDNIREEEIEGVELPPFVKVGRGLYAEAGEEISPHIYTSILAENEIPSKLTVVIGDDQYEIGRENDMYYSAKID